MRAPPPVDYPSALTRAWRALLSLLPAAVLAALAAWLLPYAAARWDGPRPDSSMAALADPAIQAGLALALGGLAGVIAWRAWRKGASSERMLRWDGQDWVLRHSPTGRPEERGDAALMLDLGAWMLVRFVPRVAGTRASRGATWLALTLSGDPARWAALRGALWNWRTQRAGRP